MALNRVIITMYLSIQNPFIFVTSGQDPHMKVGWFLLKLQYSTVLFPVPASIANFIAHNLKVSSFPNQCEISKL